MEENQIFEKIIDIKTSVINSQNTLITEKNANKIEGKNQYESIKAKNKEGKKKIIIMNEKEDLNSANSKRSNENILLLRKNKRNFRQISDDEYIDKFKTYFNPKSKLYENKISNEDINYDVTLSEKDNEINNKSDIYQEKEEEEEEININTIFNLITSYDIYKTIELNYIKLFFFNDIPEDKTLNTNINKIKKENNTNNEFNYNLEIIRNNKIYFFAKIKKTFPSINITIYIKSSNNQYIKVGKIISNVLKNNFILYKGDNKNNYKKILNINYDLNFFGFKVRNMTVEKIINNEIKYILCNDSPEWDYEYKTYKLNFNGRVKKSSKKNFILKFKNPQKENEIVNNERILQCGKIDDYSFALDFISPLSPFEAFSISISSIIYKFSCE